MSATTASAPETTSPAPGENHPLNGGALASLLAFRLVAFAVAQAVIALILLLADVDDPWRASAAWWPLGAAAANLVNLGLLSRLMQSEGRRLRDLYRPAPTWKRDALWALLVTVIAAPLSAGPNILLATALWGDPQIALDLFVQPLPMWAAIIAMIAFPVTTALAELPTYYGFIQPRLARVARSAWIVVLVPAVFHAMQHVTLPLLFDPAFMLWRAVMFLPFAILLGIALRKRPAMLPFLLIVHFLLDAQAAAMVLMVAY